VKNTHRTAVLASLVAVAITAATQNSSRQEARKPLVLKEQGSFFVGGETRSLNSTPAGGEITVTCSIGYRPAAIITSRSSWCTGVASVARPGKPPPTAGWAGANTSSVKTAPFVWRIRFPAPARVSTPPPSMRSRQNTPWPDGQFPIKAVEELYKQMIPDSTPHSRGVFLPVSFRTSVRTAIRLPAFFSPWAKLQRHTSWCHLEVIPDPANTRPFAVNLLLPVWR
jgi:hypothetical protein